MQSYRIEPDGPSVTAPPKTAWRHVLLPYGQWTAENGTEILFGREYWPLWLRPAGEAGAAKPHR